jgi:release factor glutamine methyltransferase
MKVLSSKAFFLNNQSFLKEKTEYAQGEIQVMVFELMKHFLDLDKTQVLADAPFTPDLTSLQNFQQALQEMSENKPLQYVLAQTEFYGFAFKVNTHVLIPRPETEELVQWIVQENKTTQPLSILDMGTGSGCIAITLAKKLAQAQIYALDISTEALEMAQINAAIHQAKICFLQGDILSFPDLNFLLPEKLDVIVSNPPYIPQAEKKLMRKNVLDYEPHLALFVEDTKPLIFYEKIAAFAHSFLNPKGKLYVEINEQFGQEVEALMQKQGFQNIEIKQDLAGKDRFVRGNI